MFEGGPLSELLDHDDVVAAAAPYTRIIVRVPEAYLLLVPFRTKRPGLLVVDADMRRVHAIALAGATPETVARELREAAKMPATERFEVRMKGDGAKGIVKSLRMLKTVASVKVGKSSTVIRADRRALRPDDLRALADAKKVEIEFVDPVEVQVGGARRYIPRLLLHPNGDGKADDVVARTFDLPDVDKGAGGARVAAAPLKVPGVLAVFPDLFADEQLVVARKGAVDWDAVRRSFVDAGCEQAAPSK